ncbi:MULTISPECIES: four helix bundle protein [Marinifilum]|uniref:four helix bundle protein n=1 Tax=Marinifilum TaxID=866673 RepID=UPI0027CEDA6C|nr:MULTISPECIES: four helix bundle protein [Marinifilum]MDQ2179806.1 four helix bundle protein [Marinifilum sp. D714]
MANINRFEDLIIWQESRVFVKLIYNSFNSQKDYGFKDQIQRASVSVMNNIAEGFERYSNKEFVQFLRIAKSSCAEVRSMLYVAEDLNYITQNEARDLRETGMKISGSIQNLIKKLQQRP